MAEVENRDWKKDKRQLRAEECREAEKDMHLLHAVESRLGETVGGDVVKQ